MGEGGGFARGTASLFLALALLATSTPADETDAAAYEKARADLVPRLRALSAWCEGEGLWLERNRACEAVLALAPDDAAARKALHYERDKDGTWRRGIVPKSSPTDPARVADVMAHRDEALGAFRTSALALAAGHDVALGERALQDLLGVDPDCAEARAADHETLVQDKWLLDETVSAKTRRKALIAAVEAARKSSAAPAKSPPTAEETSLAAWTDARDGGWVRALAGPKVLDADAVVRAAGVVSSTYETVVGVAPSPAARLRLLLFAGKADGLAVVDRDQRVSAEDRKWARNLTCLDVEKTDDVYVWSSDPPSREEHCLREALKEELWRSFAVKNKPIWAREGLGHLYSEIVLGTHWCYSCKRSDYAPGQKPADDLHARLFEKPCDWLAEGRELAKGARWPDLRVSLSRDASTAVAEDSLVAYLLARYLVEGRPEVVADVLRAVGRGETPDVWVPARLGTTVEGLDRRLKRYLRETKAP